MTSDVRERHRPCVCYGNPEHCICAHVDLSEPWPCDAIQQADRADKAEADRDRMRAMVHEADESRNRAVRDAKAAEALLAECREALKDAVHDLTADWEVAGGPRTNYDKVTALIARLETDTCPLCKQAGAHVVVGHETIPDHRWRWGAVQP